MIDHVSVDGLDIAYRREGHGPPLVLLHGAVSDSRHWWLQTAGLVNEFSVIAWDAPGCGASSDPPESFRMPEYADILGGLLTAIDVGPAPVVGHSWGSTLALELYRRRPEMVATLVLVGGYAGWAGSLPPDEVAARLAFALDIAGRDPSDFDPTSMRGLFSNAMPPAHAERLIAMMSEIRPAGTRAMAHALAEADLRDMLATVRVPTLLLYGTDDERSGPEVARALHAAIPNSTLRMLAGLGHECLLEDPDLCTAEIRSFLSDQERT